MKKEAQRQKQTYDKRETMRNRRKKTKAHAERMVDERREKGKTQRETEASTKQEKYRDNQVGKDGHRCRENRR